MTASGEPAAHDRRGDPHPGPAPVPTPPPVGRVAADRRLEHAVGRLLGIGTLVSVTLMAAGVLAMLAAGIAPLGGGAPGLDPVRLPGDLAALRPTGFLWLGLMVIIVTPAGRVAASLVGYLIEGDRRMAGIAIAILAVICLSVGLALGTAG